ncbi:MAG: 5'-deoxynucleotidase [Clostridia bacterium]|nr:5'-deoxynucleotidase [Clostridia bacterium]
MFEIFAYVERMKYIRRWSLMRALREETDTEHSFQVAYIAHALALIENHIYANKADVGAVLASALYHDLSETVTGDMPTPVKYYRPEMREIYGALEEDTKERLLLTLPEPLRKPYADIIRTREDSLEYRLVKAADRLSAYIKCLEEIKCGNGEFRRAMEGKKKELEDSVLPSVSYFMENIIPVYARSLDELELPFAPTD